MISGFGRQGKETPTRDGSEPFARYDIEQVRHILPQLIDGLSDAVLVVDRAHRVVAANRRYVEAFGSDHPRMLGTRCREGVCCPLDGGGEGPACIACDVLTSGEPRRLIHAVTDGDGVLRRWEATLNPVLDPSGEVSHIVEVWRDITDRSQLEGQLSHSERLASLGMLAAGVAHEINNPMASILAGVESLQRWLARTATLTSEQEAEADEVLGMLERETQRSRAITDKLLMLAQPYSGASAWVDVNRAGRDTVTLLGYQMRQQNIEVVEVFEEPLPALWGRESGIRGIWLNLGMNAVQAMPDGGTLTLRTLRRGDHVVLEVEDSGPGIERKHLDRIWDPFFTTKPPGKGTGLGLSITQRIVQKHAGTINVQTAPGRGARFIVELPLHGPGGQRG